MLSYKTFQGLHRGIVSRFEMAGFLRNICQLPGFGAMEVKGLGDNMIRL